MKLQSLIVVSVFSLLLSLSFTQCSSAQKSFKISDTFEVIKNDNSEVYYRHWVAGVRGGGSGTNVFIHESILEGKVVDSIYFQNKVAKLIAPYKTNEFFTANFRRGLNQLKNPVLETDGGISTKPIEEFFPFELGDNEAVISYFEKDEIRYLKIRNMVKEESLAYPSAPRRGIR
jgi:hypothetical protein